MAKFYVEKLITNTQGQDGSSISVFDELEKAKINFHSSSASLLNAKDVYYAIVRIFNEIGGEIAKEVIDHKPEPEPEPESPTDK